MTTLRARIGLPTVTAAGGLVCLTTGLALVSIPLALIVVGALLLGLGLWAALKG
jgi:hypothetical protein